MSCRTQQLAGGISCTVTGERDAKWLVLVQAHLLWLQAAQEAMPGHKIEHVRALEAQQNAQGQLEVALSLVQVCCRLQQGH